MLNLLALHIQANCSCIYETIYHSIGDGLREANKPILRVKQAGKLISLVASAFKYNDIFDP